MRARAKAKAGASARASEREIESERGREGGREEGREGGREGGRKGGREGGREREEGGEVIETIGRARSPSGGPRRDLTAVQDTKVHASRVVCVVAAAQCTGRIPAARAFGREYRP